MPARTGLRVRHVHGAAGHTRPWFLASLLPTSLYVLVEDIASREVGSILARLWEWVVDRGAANAPVGVSRTRHRAMEALSQTLIAAGAPTSGRVVPVALVDGAHGFTYLRMDSTITANYEMSEIKWRLTGERDRLYVGSGRPGAWGPV